MGGGVGITVKSDLEIFIKVVWSSEGNDPQDRHWHWRYSERQDVESCGTSESRRGKAARLADTRLALYYLPERGPSCMNFGHLVGVNP